MTAGAAGFGGFGDSSRMGGGGEGGDAFARSGWHEQRPGQGSGVVDGMAAGFAGEGEAFGRGEGRREEEVFGGGEAGAEGEGGVENMAMGSTNPSQVRRGDGPAGGNEAFFDFGVVRVDM